MTYSRSFLFCKRCRKGTFHSCQEVEQNGERRKMYRCDRCDAESSRPLHDVPKQAA